MKVAPSESIMQQWPSITKSTHLEVNRFFHPLPVFELVVSVLCIGYSTGEDCRGYSSMDVHVLNTRTNRWFRHPVSDLPYFENDDILPYRRYFSLQRL